jgi:hypothetical protein
MMDMEKHSPLSSSKAHIIELGKALSLIQFKGSYDQMWKSIVPDPVHRSE